MGTQRIVGLFVALGIVIGGIVFFRTKAPTQETIRVCTWSNYFPEEVLKLFTERTHIKVELNYISSNEELFAKLKAGATGLDVIQPSDYMIRQLASSSMVRKLDQSKLPNLKHLDDYYKNLPYDRGFQYSVPFTWGTTGIAVNTAKVKLPEGKVSWNLLLNSPDPKHTSMLDDMREVFSAVLLSHGKDPNVRDAATLEQAKKEIGVLKDKILMFSSEPKPLLLKEELTVAHMYSVDAIQAGMENKDIKFFIPSEGGIVWTDNFAIPSSTQKVEAAHKFIDYFLDPDNALAILTTNHLATPNRDARLKLPADEQNNPNLYPSPEVMSRLHFLEDLGDTLQVVNRMWTELKS